MIKRIVSIIMLVLVINNYTISVSASTISTRTVSEESNGQSINTKKDKRIMPDCYDNYKMCFIDEDDKLISDKITITEECYDQVPVALDKEGYTFWGWKLTGVDKGTWYYSAVYKSNAQSNYELLYSDNTRININKDINCAGNYKLVFNDDKGKKISSIEIPSGYESKMPIPKEKQGCYFWGFSIVNVERGGWLYRVVYKNYNEPQHNKNEGNTDMEPKKESDVSSDISEKHDENINNSSDESDTSDNKIIIISFLLLIMSSYLINKIKKHVK